MLLCPLISRKHLSTDETIKTELAIDMSEIQNECQNVAAEGGDVA